MKIPFFHPTAVAAFLAVAASPVHAQISTPPMIRTSYYSPGTAYAGGSPWPTYYNPPPASYYGYPNYYSGYAYPSVGVYYGGGYRSNYGNYGGYRGNYGNYGGYRAGYRGNRGGFGGRRR